MGDHRLTPDGIQARELTRNERALLVRAQDQMLQVRAPRLLDSPQDRLFVAAMDGTGNSLHKDAPENLTIVAELSTELRGVGNPAIAVGYVEGVGTQEGVWNSAVDSALATTFQARVEQAYLGFCVQAAEWFQEDPNARIRLAGIGFSRGAESIAALQRMIHERGIRDPLGADVRYDADGVLTSISWAEGPLLARPGQTVQVAILIDPVATGLRDEDRRLPASNVGTLQFTSIHEPRDHFMATMHVPAGLSEGGRVANLIVAGAHSDVGGAYRIDGVGRVVRNASVDYVNMLVGEPVLQKVPEPFDPRMFVVHSSDQHRGGLWPTAAYRRNGERESHTDLAPACRELPPAPCLRDAVDFRLSDTLEWSNVARGPTPGGSDAKMDAALTAIDRMHARDITLLDRVAASTQFPGRAQVLVATQGIGEMFDQLAESARRGDFNGMSVAARMYGETPAGQILKPGLVFAQAWLEARENLSARPGVQQSAGTQHPLLPEAHRPLQHQHPAQTMSHP